MSKERISGRRGGAERGVALVVVILGLMVVTGIAGAVMTIVHSSNRELHGATEEMRAFYLAESGVSRGMAELLAGNQAGVGPTAFGGGEYEVQIVPTGVDTFTIVSRAALGNNRRAIETVVGLLPDMYANAVFAGNSSSDPAYVLEFGGLGARADEINGDVYSGNDVELEDDAAVNGVIRATGAILGASGLTGVSLPIPDIAAMQYETTSDIDVATEFGSASWNLNLFNPALGPGWELPADNPAHIFRRNPLNRDDQTALTAKDDYVLEDPYEPVGLDPLSNGSSAWAITPTGGGQPGPEGNDLVYFVDGNLWIMNLLSNSFEFQHPDGCRITFVVKGNVYLGDNLFYDNPSLDGVAFIAIEDSSVPDSGNVYMGDLLDGSAAPVQGSLTHVDSFLYAENDFYDNNLDHQGLGPVEVNGSMIAGNQVHYKRDLLVPRPKLVINQDDRLETGALALNGLPTLPSATARLAVLSTREIAY